MDSTNSASYVCTADVAAFVDALETINCNEAEVYVDTYEPSENVVICISDTSNNTMTKEVEESIEIEDTVSEDAIRYFNPDTRKQKSIMQQLVAKKKAIIVKKSLLSTKGNKQFKSDVWNWFGDVRLLISESEAERLKIPYYTRQIGDEIVMICKVFVGCFKCSALFMYDAQRHSTSTLRYHVRACTRPKECIFVSDDKMEEEYSEATNENIRIQVPPDGNINPATGKMKRFRTDPRKQKEVIEQLFQKQKAVVTRKSFMNMKGNRRFKSDVWNWFGDIKLLISRSEAKKLKIPYYIRRCGDEQMVLSKIFVGCFKCLALFIHDSQKSTSTLRYHIRTCSRPKERKKRSTPNIIFFPNKKLPKQPGAFTDGDAILAHEKLLNFALSTESSLEVIKDPEFRKILQMCITIGAIYGDVNIDSLLCATPTLSSIILKDLYMTSINAFYTEFQYSYGVTYGLNIWIDEQIKSPFISAFVSYATSEGELKSVIIHTDEFDYDAKTSDNVQEWFSTFIADQPVVPFKRLMIIDNTSNLAHAFKDEQCIKCCVQNLNTVLQNLCTKAVNLSNSDVPDFTNLLSNCIDIVNHFEQISDVYKLEEELVRCQDDNWATILSLFRSIDFQYENILNILNETGDTHLLSAERSTINSVVEFLKVFEEAIMQLSNSSEPTLNLVIPWVSKLQKLCNIERDEITILKQLKSSIAGEINDHVVKNLNVYHRIATVLDPRFKKMNFGPQTEQREANVKLKCLVKECVESPNMEDIIENRKINCELDHFADPYSNSFDSSKCEKAAIEEVEKYMAESFTLVGPDLKEQNKFPILKYWTQHAEMYPYLSRIALWILSCPASYIQDSGPFWRNNWLVNCPRLPLQPDSVNKILFVKSFRGL